MSCGQCFECDNCVVYCPQTAVFKVPKAQVDHRALRRHRLRQVHRLPHLQGRVPDRLHPDGAGRVNTTQRRAIARRAAAWLALACAALDRRGAGAGDGGRPRARAGDREGARRIVRGRPGLHAPEPHGSAEAPAQRDGAPRRARRALQPEGLHRMPCQPRDRQRRGGTDRFLRQLPRYAAVKVDCFECHASKPAATAALPANHPGGARVAAMWQPPPAQAASTR